MLKKLEKKDFDTYISIAYQISMDLSKTSFPVYVDGIKTKENFIQRAKKGLQSKNEEILIFVDNGSVQGLIHYYVLEEDKYIGVNFISIRESYTKALRELLDYWRIRYSGYEWNIYFPEQNVNAISYMAQIGYEDAEQSVVEILLFDEYHIQPESNSIIPITKENFQEFSNIHHRFEKDMYWTSERILEDLDYWEVFVLPNKGAIYYNGKERGNLEIFGIDICEEESSGDTSKLLLISALNHAKKSNGKSMYFFTESDMKQIAESLGFHYITVAHFFSGIVA
jgi:N-acetylglutamate synthase-like GNAT family acetyltransferase